MTESTILYAKTELGGILVRPDSRQVMLKAVEGHPVQVESAVDYSKLYQVFERLRTTSDDWANLALVRRQIGTSRWLLYVLPKSETPPAVKYDENYDPKRGRYKRYAKQLAAGEALRFTDEAEAIKARSAWRLHVPATQRRHLTFTLRRIVKSNTWIALIIPAGEPRSRDVLSDEPAGAPQPPATRTRKRRKNEPASPNVPPRSRHSSHAEPRTPFRAGQKHRRDLQNHPSKLVAPAKAQQFPRSIHKPMLNRPLLLPALAASMSSNSPSKRASSVTFRGRKFTQKDLRTIRKLVDRYSQCGRTRISEEVCKALRWVQPNGWLKDRACRDVLRQMEVAKILRLPAPKNVINNKRGSHARAEISRWLDTTTIDSAEGELLVVLAKGDESEAVWNHLVATYHYLGHTVVVGRCLKFLVYHGDRIVAAISLSEASWAVADRDEVLSRLSISRHEVANNSRFLIPPYVHVKNLASRVLAAFVREAVPIWNGYYNAELRCLETYVDMSRFHGTAYRAANWIGVGVSKGYQKCGHTHSNGQTPKFVLLYPLEAHARKLLNQSLLIDRATCEASNN